MQPHTTRTVYTRTASLLKCLSCRASPRSPYRARTSVGSAIDGAPIPQVGSGAPVHPLCHINRNAAVLTKTRPHQPLNAHTTAGLPSQSFTRPAAPVPPLAPRLTVLLSHRWDLERQSTRFAKLQSHRCRAREDWPTSALCAHSNEESTPSHRWNLDPLLRACPSFRWPSSARSSPRACLRLHLPCCELSPPSSWSLRLASTCPPALTSLL